MPLKPDYKGLIEILLFVVVTCFFASIFISPLMFKIAIFLVVYFELTKNKT